MSKSYKHPKDKKELDKEKRPKRQNKRKPLNSWAN
jgi:hypothetical protein